MNGFKKEIFSMMFSAVVLFTQPILGDQSGPAGQSPCQAMGMTAAIAQKAPEYAPMAGPGKKIPIDNDYYFIYEFDKKPKLGTVILKVVIFNKQGKNDTSFEVKADAGMPSMKGAHETGERSFALSKKGEYLLPIPIVMPGVWEIRLIIQKGGETVFRGSYQFDV